MLEGKYPARLALILRICPWQRVVSQVGGRIWKFCNAKYDQDSDSLWSGASSFDMAISVIPGGY
jgi:hypothetical protein